MYVVSEITQVRGFVCHLLRIMTILLCIIFYGV